MEDNGIPAAGDRLPRIMITRWQPSPPMSKRQVQKMFRLMAGGGVGEVTSAMASVKKLARLAFVAQQFRYEYADVRQGGGHNGALRMLIVPDPGPLARQRAAQSWAQCPQAASGGPLPPFVPNALELLKARIYFDLTGKSAEKRMLHGAFGGTAGCVVPALRTGGDGVAFAGSGICGRCSSGSSASGSPSPASAMRSSPRGCGPPGSRL